MFKYNLRVLESRGQARIFGLEREEVIRMWENPPYTRNLV
jgi:hypothetical protein